MSSETILILEEQIRLIFHIEYTGHNDSIRVDDLFGQL